MQIKDLKIGNIYSNKDIIETFKCGNMGGMRRSRKTNTLMIVSDHTKGLYDDMWHGKVLHYTGMGKVGDQVLDGNQNRTLYDSDHNGIAVHLFEVMEPKEYTYRGQVKLVDAPYKAKQKDDIGNLREVWMFPLKPVEDGSVVVPKKYSIPDQKKDYEKEKKILDANASPEFANSLPDEVLKNAAELRGRKIVEEKQVITIQRERDPYVTEYAKRVANGICALCKKPAPFVDGKGKPYLETHHVVWLSQGGSDTIDNTVALCPNCHKKMHIVADEEDVKSLKIAAFNTRFN